MRLRLCDSLSVVGLASKEFESFHCMVKPANQKKIIPVIMTNHKPRFPASHNLRRHSEYLFEQHLNRRLIYCNSHEIFYHHFFVVQDAN